MKPSQPARYHQAGTAQHGLYVDPLKVSKQKMATVNWTHEEVFKLISIWSDATIQEKLEGCRRNSQVYKKISDDLRSAGFARTLEQCREKIKKLKTEYKKIKYKRDQTGQGRYPEWEYFDALNEVLGHKHSTKPPVVVESLSMTTDEVGPDDKTQDMYIWSWGVRCNKYT